MPSKKATPVEPTLVETEINPEIVEVPQEFIDQAEAVETIDEALNPEETDEQTPFVVNELEEWKAYLTKNAKHISFSSLTFEDLAEFPAMQHSIRAIERVLKIPDRTPEEDVFVKFVINKEGFQGFRYPEVGLVNFNGTDVVCAIWHNTIQPIEDVIKASSKTRSIKFEREGSGSTAKYFMIVTPPDDEQAEVFRFRISTLITDTNYVEFKFRDLAYLKASMAPFTFNRTWLQDGTYDIIKYQCIDNRFFVCNIGGNQYYLNEYMYEALKSNESSKRPLRLIIDGTRTYTKDGITRAVRNEYIEGHAPATFFTECMEQIIVNAIEHGHFGNIDAENESPFILWYRTLSEKGGNFKVVQEMVTDYLLNTVGGKESKKSRQSIPLDPPLYVQLLGVQSCKITKANRFGFQLQLSLNGVKYTAVPNTAIKDARENGMFTNVIFNDENPISLVISDIEYWEQTKEGVTTINKKFCISWDVPQQAQLSNQKFDKLFNRFAK